MNDQDARTQRPWELFFGGVVTTVLNLHKKMNGAVNSTISTEVQSIRTRREIQVTDSTRTVS